MTTAERKLIARSTDFRRVLLAWYHRSRRPLPWRLEPSPYRTVVSELMLQQTQVATVLPYFERWMLRWPDFASLARAEASEVLAAWAGLGYYRRARLLHALAREVAAAPALPRTATAWMSFSGVGPYTAAAVASISFGDRAAVVDGNVVRVLTRLVGLRSTFATPALAVRRVTDLAGALLNPRHPGDHNQAMMELGSQVCRKAAPACEACPVRTFCNSRGKAESIPSFIPRKARRETVDRILLIRTGKVLLQRHARDRTRLAGMAELPLAKSLGIDPESEPLATRRRTIALTTYEERIHRAPAGLKVPRAVGWEWVKLADLPFAALAGPHLRWIGELKSVGR